MFGPVRIIFSLSLVMVPGFVTSSAQLSDLQRSKASSQAVPLDTLITFERTVCYGTCPSYKVTITADGSVTFEGRRFVTYVGIAKSSITREQLRKLIARFEQIKFFALKDRYETLLDGCQSEVTDHPSAITSITVDGKSKSVWHYFGCSGPEGLAELSKLEQLIDETVNSDQWIH